MKPKMSAPSHFSLANISLRYVNQTVRRASKQQRVLSLTDDAQAQKNKDWNLRGLHHGTRQCIFLVPGPLDVKIAWYEDVPTVAVPVP